MGEPLLFPSVPSGPPPDRGRLLTAQEVAELIGHVSAAWVKRTVPGKIDLGHSTKRWYANDVTAWLEAKRNEPLLRVTGAGHTL